MNKNINTEIAAANVLLDNGIKIKIPAPRLLRLFFIRTVTLSVKRPTYGQLVRISRCFLKMGITKEELSDIHLNNVHAMIAKYGNDACKIIATACFRGRWVSLIMGKLLAVHIKWNVDARYIAKLTQLLFTLSGVEDFTNIIKLMSAMRVTRPANLSQTEKGS